MPICELYHFDFLDGQDYRYTSAEVDITHDGHVWQSVPIRSGRRAKSATSDARAESVTVEIDTFAEVVREWDGAGPTRPVMLHIHAADRDDIPGTVEQVFPGIVGDVRRSGKVARFSVDARIAEMDKPGPRGAWSTRCRWVLYGDGCGLDAAAFTITGDVEDADDQDRIVTVRFASDPRDSEGPYFPGGVLEFDGEGRRIMAEEYKGEVGGQHEFELTISYWLDGLDTATTVDCTPGCDHGFSHCRFRFSNIENFGGFPTLGSVKDSPFGQGWRE